MTNAVGIDPVADPATEAGRGARQRRVRWAALAVLTILVLGLVGSWWRSGVTGPGHLARVWADDGPPDVAVSGVGDDLVVLSTDRQDIELWFGLVHRGPWPVRVVDVWDTTDRDLQLPCGLQATQVEGARAEDWYADDQDRSVEAFRAPLDDIPALRGGEELVVFLAAEGFGRPDCYGTAALHSVGTATVTYPTLGITRRTEVPLPWIFGWTDEPDAWPQVTRRDDAD